jgi:hypothetical protein
MTDVFASIQYLQIMYLKLILFLGVFSGSLLKAQINPSDSTCISEDCCACSDYAIPAGVMISHTHMKGEWMVSYRLMQMTMSGVNNGTHEINKTDVLSQYRASPDFMKMNMHMLMVMYGLTDKFTLMAMFHYNSNYMEMTMASGAKFHTHGMSSSGIGDTKLYGLWAILKKPQKEFLLSVGINLPTGNINSTGTQNSAMYPGLRYPYAMQLGSGTFDLLPTLSYLNKKNNLTWSAQLASVIRTGHNTNDYKLGNEWSSNLWVSWQWLTVLSSSLRAEITYADKIHGRDSSLNMTEEIASNPSNYGGTRGYLHVGSSINGKKRFLKKNRLSVEYGFPIYQNLNGLQMPIKNLFTASWSLTF